MMFGTNTTHPASGSSATPLPTGQAAWALLDYDDVLSVRVFTEPSWWSWLNDDHAQPPPALGTQLREMFGSDYRPHTQSGRGALTESKPATYATPTQEPGS